MATYTVLNTSAMQAENIDAFNKVGIYESGDAMNGTLFTLGAMNYDSTTKVVKDFTYAVTPATANAAAATDLWIAATPEVPVGIENIYADPREFTNKAGKPIAIKRVMVGDVIEVTAPAFGSSDDFPVASEVGYVVPVAASGKLGTPASTSTYANFKVEALSFIRIGDTDVASCILRRMA